MHSDKDQITDFQSLREACRLANHNITTDMARQQKLTKTFIENTRAHFPECIVYAQPARMLLGAIIIAYPGIPEDVMISTCPDYCFSRGSSCSSGPAGPSHPSKQIILDDRVLESTARISLGSYSKFEDMDSSAKNTQNTYS
jgi:cysteine desulfurase